MAYRTRSKKKKEKKKKLRAISTPAKLKQIWQLFGEVVNKVSLRVQHTVQQH